MDTNTKRGYLNYYHDILGSILILEEDILDFSSSAIMRPNLTVA